MMSIRKALSALLVFFFQQVAAYEECDDKLIPCYDSGSSIGYCCQYGCCWYTAWWGVWYFWFGVIVFLMFFISCITLCCKKANFEAQPAPTSRARCAHPTVTTVSAPDYRMPAAQVETVYVCELPTYADIEKQGIPEQFVEFSEKGASNSAFQ